MRQPAHSRRCRPTAVPGRWRRPALAFVPIVAVLAAPLHADPTPTTRIEARVSAVAAPGLAMPPRVALVPAETTDLNLWLEPVIAAELRRVGILVDDGAPARLQFGTRVRRLPTWRPPFTITNADPSHDPLHKRGNRPVVEVPIPEFGQPSPESGPTYVLSFTLAEAGRPVLWRAVGEANASGWSPRQVIGALVPPLIAHYGESAGERAITLP